MGDLHEQIDAGLADWLCRQHLFFVATAPLSADGHVNCSPKGGDCFRIIGPLEVAYQDYTGSGAETAAHVRENGRIVLMFCAFNGKPMIARLHGRGEIVRPGDPQFESLALRFPDNPATRSFVRIDLDRVSTSCGFGVPLMEFSADRDVLDKWAKAKGADGLAQYQATKNAVSIDGLEAIR